MKVQATHRHARMAPRKIRPLARLLRGMKVEEAAVQLQFMPGKASELLGAVLKSAVANSEHNHEVPAADLKIAEVRVDEGITMKRFQPVSRGMAHPILKRTSHVTIVVEGEQAKKKATKKAAKNEIATMSPGEYESQRAEMQEEHEEEVVEQPLSKTATEVRPVAEREDKENYEAQQKKRMVQQGGDAAKSSRRVTKKGDK